MAVGDVIRESADDFERHVWPLVSHYLGGGNLVPVESVTDSRFAELLDTLGMTDVWQVVPGQGLRALATRIQWGEQAWDSFTIRRHTQYGGRTEYHKLLDDGHWHRPSYVIQAYLLAQGRGPVISAACVRLDVLAEMVRVGRHGHELRNPYDGNRFIPVWWKDIEDAGYEIWRYPAPDALPDATPGAPAGGMDTQRRDPITGNGDSPAPDTSIANSEAGT